MIYIDTQDIAAITGLSRRYVTDVVIKQAWFPVPVIKLSQRTVRWDDDAVRLALSSNKIVTPRRKVRA